MSIAFKSYPFALNESGFDLPPDESRTTPPVIHEIKTPNGKWVQIDLNPRLNDSRLEPEKTDDYFKFLFGCKKPQTRPLEKTGQVDKSK